MTTPLADRLASLGLHATSQGLADLIARATKARWGANELLEHLADEEQKERGRRSLERRLSRSRLGRFKPMAVGACRRDYTSAVGLGGITSPVGL